MWAFCEESKPTIFLCSLGISYMTKNVDDHLGICSAVFKNQNSKWPPYERVNGIKLSKMIIGTYAVNQFYVFSSQKIQS